MTVGAVLQQALAGLASAGDLEQAARLTELCPGVAYDSRTVAPGQIFVALKGRHADGAAYAAQAAAAGASAVVAEEPAGPASTIPWIVVPDARLALAHLAAEYFEHPSRDLRVVGITGTNGKTTTAYLVAAIFEAAGTRCGMIGTVEYRVGADARFPRRAPRRRRPNCRGCCGGCARKDATRARWRCRRTRWRCAVPTPSGSRAPCSPT